MISHIQRPGRPLAGIAEEIMADPPSPPAPTSAPSPAVQRLSLLVVEDEIPLAQLWASELSRQAEVRLAHTIEEARQRLRGRAFDALLLDLHLPDGNGIDLLKEIATRGDDTNVIILTGNADLPSAVQALRFGAYDYLTKPCRIVELEQLLARLARQQALRNENQALRQQISASRPPEPLLVGSGPALSRVRELIARVAPAGTAVLITGETGTGKELAARMVHAQSPRARHEFVPVNCAALPKELVESELFGHRGGAVSGAERDHRGLVAAAAGGTLFLDEVGDLPLEVQGKFLRLLESGEARRLGDTEPYRSDVRIVAATHRDLRGEVQAGRFRHDLFYRLSAFELPLPPLRELLDDLPAIAEHLLVTIAVPGARAERFSAAALTALKDYVWPGNVRELRNVVERAKILCEQSEILIDHLNLPTRSTQGSISVLGSELAGKTIADVERLMIDQALNHSNGNKTAAARLLGISLRTLYNKLESRSASLRSAGVSARAGEHPPAGSEHERP